MGNTTASHCYSVLNPSEIEPMQDLHSIARHPHLSERLAESWKRIRRVRRDIYRPLRKTGAYTEKVLPSQPKSNGNNPYVSDPKRPPPSATPLRDIKILSQEMSISANSLHGPAMDGAGEERSAGGHPHPIAAIFVHAGAGYHSTTNERIHLGACKDAARMAMSILKSGESAVAAVEAAIRVLEDKEITNAGFGSNLTIEGIVECDATIVDHLGRSGACGATAKIRNPIHLARVILDASSRPLSLRRVPPNLLVGEGATTFAWEHNVSVVPHDALVSKSARERFVRWREDLRRAARARLTPDSLSSPSTTYEEEMVDLEYEEKVRNQQRRDHTDAMLCGTWNEGQPGSPQPQSPLSAPKYISIDSLPYSTHSQRSSDTGLGTPSSPGRISSTGMSPLCPISRSSVTYSSPDSSSPAKRLRYAADRSTDGQSHSHSLLQPGSEISKSIPDLDFTGGNIAVIDNTRRTESTDGPTSPKSEFFPDLDASVFPTSRESTPRVMQSQFGEDTITDTVGAIAIDIFGNIAAGSSSGGIGMKHRGRVGPAALVGIGTAVVPVDPEDRDGITVAAVTSGTGEHMATTMASQKCAERLYFGNRRAPGGLSVPATEEESMQSFVQSDFMDHPGVRNGHSGGAIGVMAVKKTPYGFFLHFAHNTDSFALASMHSNEKDAKCVMSRLGDHSSVVQGGRKIRLN